MIPEGFPDRVRHLFERARGLAPAQREALLLEACGDDLSLLAEVRALLDHDLGPGASAFLERVDLGISDGGNSPRSSPLHAALPDEDDVAGFPVDLPEFRCLRRLGRGGMGEVFLAEQREPRRLVAIKWIRRDLIGDSKMRERFRLEVATLSRIDHPGICTVYQSGVIEGQPYVAMRYIEGETLAARLQATRRGSRTTVPSTRSDIDAAVLLVEKVARALHAAHEAGILHRDIKPGNVMVTAAEEPVILDFGLSRESESERQESALTRSGERLGTPAYMSPEQISGRSKAVDRRSDVYSLGVTLFECLTGEKPFSAVTSEQLYLEILSGGEARCGQLNPAIPRDLRTVVETSMDRDPARRYRTALDFAEDLRRVRERLPTLARPVGPILRLRRWTQRNPVLAATVTLLAVGLSAFAWQWHRAEVGARQERWERERATRAEVRARALLRDLLDLAVFEEIESLERRADQDLWPARSDRLPAIRHWLVEAKRLSAKLPHLERKLAELESEALPPTSEEKPAGEDPTAAREEGVPGAGTVRAAGVGDRTWRFTADADGEVSAEEKFWRHRQLLTIVERLRHFVTGPEIPEGTLGIWGSSIPEVTRRIPRIEEWRRKSLEDASAQEAWQRAIAYAAQDPSVGPYGFRLQAIEGLLPLGVNPRTQLLEFWHVPSGDEPKPDRSWIGTGPERAPGKRVRVPNRWRLTPESGVTLVLIPGGRYLVGAQSTNPVLPHFDPDEPLDASVRAAELEPFLISKYELTQAQWLRWCGSNPSVYAWSPLQPVEAVSYLAAMEWTRRAGMTLPSEVPWEVAARGRTGSRFGTGDEVWTLQHAANLADWSFLRSVDSALVDLVEWDDGEAVHAVVGSFRPNPFGLHDVIGNVGEWCRNRSHAFHEYYDPFGFESPRLGDPTSSLRPVIRGSGFDHGGFHSRITRAHASGPDNRQPNLGLRPAILLPPK